MDEHSTRVLIPMEELERHRAALTAARALAQQNQQEAGRRLLGEGLERALALGRQPWGQELIWVWLQALRRWDQSGRERGFG